MKKYKGIPAFNNSYLGGLSASGSLDHLAEAFSFGTLMHKIALEPSTITQEDCANSRFKEALALANVFNNHPLTMAARACGNVKAEYTQHRVITLPYYKGYQETSLPAKCRHDLFSDLPKLSIDAKTTSAISREGVMSSFYNYNYDRAAFWYMTIGQLETMVFLFLSKKTKEVFPYIVQKESEAWSSGKDKAYRHVHSLRARGEVDDMNVKYKQWLKKQ